MDLQRKKPRRFLVSFIYRLSQIPFASKKRKFRLFLDLEWIFDRLAHEYSFKTYSTSTHPARTFSKNFLSKYIRETDTVLDIGSNTGALSFIIAEKAAFVIGVEHNSELVEIARKNNQRQNLEFILMDALAFLEQNAKKFDVLLLSHVLGYFENTREFLLKNKGSVNYIYIETPDFDKHYLNQYRKDLGMSLIYSDPGYVCEFDRFELAKILNDCGIEIIEAEYMHGLQKLWCKVN